MIAALTLGFALFGVALGLFYLYSTYLRRSTEGFHDIPNSLFVPKVAPGGFEMASPLSPGPANNELTEKLVASPQLPALSLSDAQGNWAEMTSERCFRSDKGEALKKTQNYLQRTNNYQHEHPDDCSAPNHEFVGTFYAPFDGVGKTPESGTKMPPSTQRCVA